MGGERGKMGGVQPLTLLGGGSSGEALFLHGGEGGQEVMGSRWGAGGGGSVCCTHSSASFSSRLFCRGIKRDLGGGGVG